MSVLKKKSRLFVWAKNSLQLANKLEFGYGLDFPVLFREIRETTYHVATNICGNTCVMKRILSNGVTSIQWIKSCHKNDMTTRHITLGYWRLTSSRRLWQRYIFCCKTVEIIRQ